MKQMKETIFAFIRGNLEHVIISIFLFGLHYKQHLKNWYAISSFPVKFPVLQNTVGLPGYHFEKGTCTTNLASTCTLMKCSVRVLVHMSLLLWVCCMLRSLSVSRNPVHYQAVRRGSLTLECDSVFCEPGCAPYYSRGGPHNCWYNTEQNGGWRTKAKLRPGPLSTKRCILCDYR